ncbi:sucrose synthase [Melioribacteraceae bacterium 4301-Me]|uniref:sucrose synthase n=1 Tax=Pyranulibacter aquaticus TaxID=3163344 RepID=UPI0035997B43
MIDSFQTFVEQNELIFYDYFKYISTQPKKMLVSGEIQKMFDEFIKTNNNYSSQDKLKSIIAKIEESVSLDHTMYLEVRQKIASSNFYRVNLEERIINNSEPSEFLEAKEFLVRPGSISDTITLNFKPFNDKTPAVRDIKSIGSGVEYLNRYLSSMMFNEVEKWQNILFDFIRVHKYENQQLILNDRIKNIQHLNEQINIAVQELSELKKETPFENVCHRLQELGFEKGLGKDVAEIIDKLKLLYQLLNSPDHESLRKFISSIPMIFKIAIISPHGFFAQQNVLGKPDTGGQVVYILDQVKALEKSLLESAKLSGLDSIQPKIVVLTRLIPNSEGTTCNKRIEKINGTKNSWILRVPFIDKNNKIVNDWISRFKVWPYLERFAEQAYIELMAEFNGRPDLIIGNYSDGNLVSFLLSKKFKVTQCCIAHALEKSKYLYSALYWFDLENQYNFSIQFTSDLITINSADFLITSSFQEIAGTENSIGQYESYKHFTMPGLYRVINGVNPFHTKFNIVSPGVNEKIFFSYKKKEKRLSKNSVLLRQLLFENIEAANVIGSLKEPDKTPLFSMARLDRIKNLTSLVKWFGESKELQELCNLIIVSGKIDQSLSNDDEEKEQITLMHNLINKYKLSDKIRWIGKLFNKDETGEIYRIIADKKGIFIQPALFEGFGLTVLEAMSSGLPVFATKYGGPLEIIQNKQNGFHIDPINQLETTNKILDFVREIKKDPSQWEFISKNAINRVNEKYNWKLYSQKLISLAKIYGFWKYATNIQRADMEAYLDLIYHTIFKPRAKKLES